MTHRLPDGTETVRIVVPRGQVRPVLEVLAEAFPGEPGLAVHPIPLRTLFHVAATTELDAVEVRPVIEALQAEGERAYLDGEELERFRYGSLVWVKELGVLADLERPGENRRFAAPAQVTLRGHQIPGFLEAVGEEAVVGDGVVARLRVHHDWDALEIAPEAEGKGTLRVKIGCEFDGAVVPLGDLLDARRRGAPYFDTASGWVKLDAPAFARIEAALSQSPTARLEGDTARLSAADLFRLGAAGAGAFRVGGDPARSVWLRRLLALRPAQPWRRPAALASELRDYQVRGVEWLRFLAENGLSGLLCDEMGLGKTHQAMALMASLREDGATDPSLVVCPTTVIGHWRDKLARFAAGLRAAVHHGAGRSLDEALASADVVVTSYGILRNDVELFAARRFALAVFDEIQQAKNRETLAHEAIRRIDAGIRVGLTGTPVENRVGDLEALLNLALPGYIAAAGRTPPRKGDPSRADLDHLRRLAAPFVLRRLKASVLDELPEKIEDLRRATLSSNQIHLYREALARRGASLARDLADGAKPVPYLHVFALLDHLKQICDHPALALGTPARFAQYESGKWDLFQEILLEALDGGEKVVVFTQYLGMIAILEKLLGSLGVDYAELTGQTRDRSGAIARFNEDPSCRVFVGSLKAGGTGIDLVGGSVVIHYDRWWNAAREDQATDRVHRIGQRWVVQVFKLVTEGTLEERIDEIIARKRELLDHVVAPDDPGVLKSFTREELLALLAPPPKENE